MLSVLLLAPTVSLAGEEDGSGTSVADKIVITGQVTTESGSVVPSARLQVWTFKDEPVRHWELKESPVVNEAGAFEVQEMDAPASLLFRTQAEGLATGWSTLDLSESGATETRIVMRPPGRVSLQVNDESGRPISGAYVRWMKIDGPNGSVSLPTHTFHDLNMPPPTSDEQGLLQIDDLPLSAKLTVGLLHDEHAPAEAKGVSIVEQGEPSTVVMNDGIPLSIQILTDELDAPIQEVTMDLRHQPFDHPSSLVYQQVPLDGSGRATLRIEAGSYRLLRFTHPDAFIGPMLEYDYDKQKFLEFDAETPVLTFHAKPIVEVQGKLVDILTGSPVENGYVSGETHSQSKEGPFAEFVSDWMFTGWGHTDAEGRYSLKLPVGPARSCYRGKGYTAHAAFRHFDVGTNGVTEAPTLELIPIRPVHGLVVDPEGAPINGAIVRFRGGWLRWAQPATTDEQGHFELEVPYIPVDDETEKLIVRHPVVAFHPRQSRVGTTWVHLDQPNEVETLKVTLQPTEDWSLIGLFEDELTPRELGQIREEEREELESMSLVGKQAPELDGRQWLNTSGQHLSLADFRGKYVLLDFWTTWCGPCHGDLPSLKLLQQLYGGEHFTIIGVHDNSVDPDKIAEHVEKHGMENPIVIDHSDGRLLREYESHGISGYPSYLLIGPDGRVLIENRTAGGPSLRVYKLEIVRQYLMEHIEAE
ncbi:MAG: redoxin domain-containing protein [Planctomycetaceae bacterium]|nr:redoxin domain-containing protein [Planctomycetaceae bacterium]